MKKCLSILLSAIMVISMAALSAVPISAEVTYFAVGSVIFDPEWASDVPEYQMQFDGEAHGTLSNLMQLVIDENADLIVDRWNEYFNK